VIRVMTVDDHPLLREGIATLIGNQTDIELVAEASNGREALEQFRKYLPGDVQVSRAFKAGARAYLLKGGKNYWRPFARSTTARSACRRNWLPEWRSTPPIPG
jgi:hypothetical protein